MHRVPLTRSDFPDARLLRGFCGGEVLVDERHGKYYVIQDESTMAEFLDDEDLADLRGHLVNVLEFDSQAEMDAYIHERGWDRLAHGVDDES